MTVANASAFGITLAPLDAGPLESAESRTGNRLLKSKSMKFPCCALMEFPLVLNQLVLKYPTVPRKLISVRKVYGVVESWAASAGFPGEAMLYTAKVGAVPGPTMSTRIGSDVLVLIAHLPPLPASSVSPNSPT